MAKHIRGKTTLQRLMSYIKVVDGNGCWEWQSYRDPNGYGRLTINQEGGRYVPMLPHRLIYEHAHGVKLEPYQHICHKCDNPSCCRPDHLFLGDAASNSADKIAKGRMRYGTSVGEKHGMARLTDDQVREIRASTGSSIKIGEKYGISGRQVRSIRRRESWKHLD